MADKEKEKYSFLLYKHLEGTLTASEQQQLAQWMSDMPDSRLLLEEMDNDAQLAEALKQYHPGNRQVLESRIWEVVKSGLPQPQVIPLYRRNFFRLAAVAAVVLLLTAGIYYSFIYRPAAKLLPQQQQVLVNEVQAPATNRATVTLADGSTVYLDSIHNGQLALQGNVKLIKLANGQIAYHLPAAQAGTASGEILKELQYNTLANPRGSKVIDMQLSDGSHVWLNAGSSVTFPVAFTGNERRVSITGEAYFEIAHDNAKKFIVTANGTTTEVLGTHFNVNAYGDESDIKITLLEGSVKVSSLITHNSSFIKPGQQATIHHSSNSSFIIHHSVDVEQAIAWKNGLFSFSDADIYTIMRQISRWYGVDVQYNKAITEKFRFKASRNTGAGNIFKILEATGEVKLKVEGKTVIVM